MGRAMISGKIFHVSGGCASDIGICREVNQDAILFHKIEQQGESFAIGAVCDGVGGMQSGEEASALVIDGIEQWFAQICEWIDIAKVECDVLFAHLKDAAEQWNGNVIEYCKSHQIRSGTTMSVIMAIRDRFYILHVGDSRIYRYNQHLEKLTMDDVFIKSVDGKERPYLTNYMGKSGHLSFTTVCGRLNKNDVFIYCSDGFYHKFEETDMERYWNDYKKNQPLDQICKNAVYTMEERRETDNISVGMIVIELSVNSLADKMRGIYNRDGIRKRNARRKNTTRSKSIDMQISRIKWVLRIPKIIIKQILVVSNSKRSKRKPIQEKRENTVINVMEENKKTSKKRSVFGIELPQFWQTPLLIK